MIDIGTIFTKTLNMKHRKEHIKMSEFKELFEEYGYTVEPFGINSYIANNGIHCVPFTEVGTENFPEISAISFLSIDIDNIKSRYKNEEYIGCRVFSDFMNDLLRFNPHGGLCNHDHSLFEVEKWLNSFKKITA